MKSNPFILASLCALLGACADPTHAPTPTATTTPTPIPAAVTAPTPAAVTAPTPAAVTAPAPDPTPASHSVIPAGHQARGSLYDLELPLEDQRGRPLDLRAFADRPLVVAMFYANCAYACPTLIQDLQNLERALPDAERQAIRVLLVTFDPHTDTPEVLASLAQRHGVDTTRWTFARTSPEGGDEHTRELAGALGIKYRRLPDGHYNHSTLITLLDQGGTPLARIDGLRQDSTAFRAIVTHALHSGAPTR